MPLRQGRQSGLQAEQAAQFAAIGHAPVALAETLFAVHRRDEIQRFLPGEGVFGKTGVAAPDEAGQPIRDGVAAHVVDREHHPAAEAVVGGALAVLSFPVGAAPLHASCLRPDHQPGWKSGAG